MGEICSKIVDGDHNPPPGQPNPTKFVMVSSKNIANDKICNISDVRYLTEHDFYSAHKRTYVEKGDILFTSVASLGRTCIYSLEEPVTFQRSVTVINTLIYNKYLKLFLDSPIYQNYVNDNARGTAQKGFYINQISDSLVPIPPLSEQIRLATKVEELLNTVCQLELLKDDLGNNIKKIKSTILDMAIIGRLIPQNPSDEPAIQLIRTINPDFRSTDNRHYENLPSGWQEVSFDHIFKSIPTKRFQVQQKEIQPKGTIPVISQSANYIEGYTDDIDKIFTATPVIVFGDHTRVVKFVDFPFVVGADGVKIYSTKIFPPYGYYLIEHAAHNIENKGYGRHSQYIAKQRYPMPPYDEQKRIVESVRKMFMTIDSIVADL